MNISIKNYKTNQVIFSANVESIKALVQQCNLWEMKYADLGGVDLSGVDFRRHFLTGARFAGSDLTGCDFRGVDVAGADFSGALLQQTDFTGARLDGANFFRADLSWSKFSRNYCFGANFNRAIFHGAKLNFSKSWAPYLKNAILDGKIIFKKAA